MNHEEVSLIFLSNTVDTFHRIHMHKRIRRKAQNPFIKRF